MKKERTPKVAVLREKKTIDVVDVPRPFIEFCIKKAETKEQKKELMKLLEASSST